MATATQGEEYKILKQKQPLMKAAGIFFWVWLAAVTCPAIWFVLSHADEIREFAVVTAVGKTNQILTEQYAAFTDRVLKEVKIEKYTSKIKIPEIKLDKQLEQVNKAAEKTNEAVKEATEKATEAAKGAAKEATDKAVDAAKEAAKEAAQKAANEITDKATEPIKQ